MSYTVINKIYLSSKAETTNGFEQGILNHKNIINEMYVKHKEMNVKVKYMQDIKSVDTSTFEQMFSEHYDGLYRYGQTIVKDQNDTEDIIQSVFMDLWNDRSKLVIHTSVKAYLYKAVYFKCMNKIKHEKVAAKYTDTFSTFENPIIEDSLILQEISDKISQTIESLPEQCRKIFSMSRMDGLRYNEIAQVLNLSPKTIENQMGKALKTMRVALSEYIQIIAITILTYL